MKIQITFDKDLSEDKVTTVMHRLRYCGIDAEQLDGGVVHIGRDGITVTHPDPAIQSRIQLALTQPN